MKGLATHDVDLIGTTLVEEVRFVTPRRVMNKTEILQFLAALYRGFPDWSYRHDPVESLGPDHYRVRWYQGGTHTGVLAFEDGASYEPTGRRVRIPPHPFDYRVTPLGLREIRPEPIPGAAPGGIFEQIGVDKPPL